MHHIRQSIETECVTLCIKPGAGFINLAYNVMAGDKSSKTSYSYASCIS